MMIILKLFKLVGHAIQGSDQTVPPVKAVLQRVSELPYLARPLQAGG
jgi:hypothetical protein